MQPTCRKRHIQVSRKGQAGQESTLQPCYPQGLEAPLLSSTAAQADPRDPMPHAEWVWHVGGSPHPHPRAILPREQGQSRAAMSKLLSFTRALLLQHFPVANGVAQHHKRSRSMGRQGGRHKKLLTALLEVNQLQREINRNFSNLAVAYFPPSLQSPNPSLTSYTKRRRVQKLNEL